MKKDFSKFVFRPKKCVHCGSDFVPGSGSAQFCSAICYLMKGAVRAENGCLIGRFSQDRYGYGQLTLAGPRTVTTAHKVSYTEHIGHIPAGQCVCHSCDNPPCIEPGHLFLGSHGDNKADSVVKRRHAFGERHPLGKLTEKQVLSIASDGRGRRVIAETYGVSIHAIADIRNGKNWGWLTGIGQ